MIFILVWVEALRPSQQFFSHVGTEPLLPEYYQCFLGGKCNACFTKSLLRLTVEEMRCVFDEI